MLIRLTKKINIRISRPIRLEVVSRPQLELKLKKSKSFNINQPASGYQLRVYKPEDELQIVSLLNNAGISFDANQLKNVFSICLPKGCFIIEHIKTKTIVSMMMARHLSNENHPFGTWKEIELGMGLARAHRVTYVGELGWELYVSTDQAVHIFEEIEKKGRDFGLKFCGMHTLDSCRLEKAFRHFGHDISDEDHILEAGLGFCAKMEKGNFIGREAIQKKKEVGLEKILLQFSLEDSNAMLFHNEPIIRDNIIVGYISSGNYGHSLGAAVGLGYVPCNGENIANIVNSKFEIEIAGKRFQAKVSKEPMYDPKSLKPKM